MFSYTIIYLQFLKIFFICYISTPNFEDFFFIYYNLPPIFEDIFTYTIFQLQFLKKNLERVVSIEGRKICQCSTNGIGASQGYTPRKTREH